MKLSVLLVVFLSYATAGLASAPGSQDQTIRVSANLVLAPVSVTNAAGEMITDLKGEDFQIEENGKPVPVARIGQPGEAPLELGLLFDITGSVRARFELERQAAESFLKTILRPIDAVSVVAVGIEPKVLQPRTTSLEQALQGLALIQPGMGATAFYDCVAAAAQMLHNISRPETRRVLVVLSDGEDNRSTEYQLPDVMRVLQESDCLFYSINPTGRGIRINRLSVEGEEGMEALALNTGGEAFVADRLEDLKDFYARIAAVLKGQYLLGYYSPDPRLDGGYRRIIVRIPARPELKIRARQGYYAGNPLPG
jgi:Ca-activated chloride channel family protein